VNEREWYTLDEMIFFSQYKQDSHLDIKEKTAREENPPSGHEDLRMYVLCVFFVEQLEATSFTFMRSSTLTLTRPPYTRIDTRPND